MNEPADRFHNRERDSPEALRRAIETLAASVADLERRLDGTAAELGGAVDGARASTRRLAADVGRMGEALSRQIQARPPAARRRFGAAFAWTAGLALVLTAAAVAALLLARRPAPHPSPAPTATYSAPKTPAPVAPTPAAPSPPPKAVRSWRPHPKWRARPRALAAVIHKPPLPEDLPADASIKP